MWLAILTVAAYDLRLVIYSSYLGQVELRWYFIIDVLISFIQIVCLELRLLFRHTWEISFSSQATRWAQPVFYLIQTLINGAVVTGFHVMLNIAGSGSHTCIIYATTHQTT